MAAVSARFLCSEQTLCASSRSTLGQRLGQPHPDSVDQRLEFSRNAAGIQFPLGGKDLRVLRIEEGENDERDARVPRLASAGDHPDRVAVVSQQLGMALENGLHTADHGRARVVEQCDAWPRGHHRWSESRLVRRRDSAGLADIAAGQERSCNAVIVAQLVLRSQEPVPDRSDWRSPGWPTTACPRSSAVPASTFHLEPWSCRWSRLNPPANAPRIATGAGGRPGRGRANRSR